MNRWLTVLALLATSAASSRFERVDRVLAEVPVPGDTLRAVAGIIRDRTSHAEPESSVVSLRILNRRGACLYSDSFFVNKGPEGALYAAVATDAWAIQWSGGSAFKLRDEAVNPVMRARFGPNYHCRYLAVRGDTVVPIMPWCKLCGDLLPGATILHGVDLGWFKVAVPLRLRFDLPMGGIEVAPERDSSAGGLAVLRTNGTRIHWWPEDPESPNAHMYPTDTLRRAFLYRAAIGADGDSITVTPASKVQFGAAYAECAPWANLGERCPDDIKVDLKRLEFSLNGRHGFLDERGLRMLGVFDPGSELHFRGPGYWDPSREWP